MQNSGSRQIPDVSFDADPNTGVAIYDSYDLGSSTPWTTIGGTSLSTACWAGLVATADQLRASQGLGTLDGASQTLPELYALPQTDFHLLIGQYWYSGSRPAGNSCRQQARPRSGIARRPRPGHDDELSVPRAPPPMVGPSP